MSQLDPKTLEHLRNNVALRVEPFGVQTTIVNDMTGADAIASPAAVTALHPLRRGSEVVATLRFSISPQTHQQLPGVLLAAARAADDVWRAETGERTLLQFTDRLEQAYEQAHLLFRLAKIPEHPRACAAALADAIERLHGITQLGWVALRFVEGAPAVSTIQGACFLAGEPPMDRSAFHSLLTEALSDAAPSVIRRPDESALAAATGAEVLLQPLTFDGQRLGMLAAGNNGGDDPGLSSFETQLFAACAGYLDTFHANVARMAQQETMFLGTLRALTASIDAKDPYTRGHSERVAMLAHDLALACGLGEATADRYRIAGLVHDIGKIGVPERVLCKAGALTEDEFAYIRRHPQIGFDILRDIPGLEDVQPGVLYHHERYDGHGYPATLGGEQIPHVARVLTLCDTFDAMSSNRSYRTRLPRDHVLKELIECAGTQFDPSMAKLFVQMDFTRFDIALSEHADAFPAPVSLAA